MCYLQSSERPVSQFENHYSSSGKTSVFPKPIPARREEHCPEFSEIVQQQRYPPTHDHEGNFRNPSFPPETSSSPSSHSSREHRGPQSSGYKHRGKSPSRGSIRGGRGRGRGRVSTPNRGSPRKASALERLGPKIDESVRPNQPSTSKAPSLEL